VAWLKPSVTPLKRDYVGVNPTPDAKTVIGQISDWLTLRGVFIR
jgi:hypothetical protein